MLPAASLRSVMSRVRSLAHVGAGRAASAYAALLGRRLRIEVPRVCESSGRAATGASDTGVLFEMEGAVEGVIAFLLAPPARAAVLEALGVAPAATESALREVGNIVASHAVSAVADHLGGRVTLSVPILVQEDAGPVLDRLLAERRGGRAGIVTTTEMRLHSGSTCGLLVFAPD